MPPPQPNADEIRRALALLYEPGDVVELRALHVPGYKDSTATHAGFFDDHEKLAKSAARLSREGGAVYVTLNPVDPVLLARARNRTIKAPQKGLTDDGLVPRRRWLLVDIDPARPVTGISSTEKEVSFAVARGGAIQKWLTARGWPSPAWAMSGNGIHLLYRVDLPGDDGGLVAQVLQALAERFTDPEVDVDVKVGNASRIVTLYGTVKRKGDEIAGRPHRVAHLGEFVEVEAVAKEQLEALVAESESDPPATGEPKAQHAALSSEFQQAEAWLAEWLARVDLQVGEPAPWRGGSRRRLKTCPNCGESDRSAVVGTHSSGGQFYKCQHSRCTAYGWSELRAAFDPDKGAAALDEAREVAAELPARAKADVGAALEPAAVAALVLLRREDTPAYMRCREALPRGCRSELDRQLRRAERAGGDKQQALRPEESVRAVQVGRRAHGWFVRDNRGQWIDRPKADAGDVLIALGADPETTRSVMGNLARDAWELVSIPFSPEYPGGHRWNRDAVQFAVQPQAGECPTWDHALHHIGRGLDHWIAHHEWCGAHGIETGRDYIEEWVRGLVWRPLTALPYLFLHGEQDSGKSCFHEALREILFTDGGVALANTALRTTFNGELLGAVVAVVEEVNLRKDLECYSLIKLWSTALSLLINPKGKPAFQVPNTLHWVQVANSLDHCPIMPGDSRITVVRVDPAAPGEAVKKEDLFRGLKKEAPAFAARLLDREPVPSFSRWGLPVIETETKAAQQAGNRNELEDFLSECDDWRALTPEEVWRGMREELGGEEGALKYWSKRKVRRKIGDLEDDRRRLASAVREWWSGGDFREPWEGSTAELVGLLPGEAGSLSPQRAGRLLGSISLDLARVGIVAARRDRDASGRGWIVHDTGLGAK